MDSQRTTYKIIEFNDLKLSIRIAEDICPKTLGYVKLKERLIVEMDTAVHQYLSQLHESQGYKY